MKEVDAEDLRIDLRSSEAIRWLNDIESGRQYWHWGQQLASLLQPMFPGQLHRVQRNLYSAVGLIDPGSAQGLQCAPPANPFLCLHVFYSCQWYCWYRPPASLLLAPMSWVTLSDLPLFLTKCSLSMQLATVKSTISVFLLICVSMLNEASHANHRGKTGGRRAACQTYFKPQHTVCWASGLISRIGPIPICRCCRLVEISNRRRPSGIFTGWPACCWSCSLPPGRSAVAPSCCHQTPSNASSSQVCAVRVP